MGLEALTGTSVFIDALNKTNPANGDELQYQDDHTRGIKNVLINTFPNVTGALTVTQGVLNDIPLPNGVQMLFRLTAAPAGWTFVGSLDDYLVGITGTESLGQGSQGDWNNATGLSSAAMSTTGSHTHTYSGTTSGVVGGTTKDTDPGADFYPTHTHTYSGTTSSAGSHTHTPGAISSAQSWRPKTAFSILCQKDIVT